jgi:hypothetical protein
MRSILVSAFALRGIVQIAPALPRETLLDDIVIVLFAVDLCHRHHSMAVT